jgi:hypothetical protein
MCSNTQPSAATAWQNLKKPMPLAKKLRLIERNAWIRISTPSTCCGHPGEPGC